MLSMHFQLISFDVLKIVFFRLCFKILLVDSTLLKMGKWEKQDVNQLKHSRIILCHKALLKFISRIHSCTWCCNTSIISPKAPKTNRNFKFVLTNKIDKNKIPKNTTVCLLQIVFIILDKKKVNGKKKMLRRLYVWQVQYSLINWNVGNVGNKSSCRLKKGKYNFQYFNWNKYLNNGYFFSECEWRTNRNNQSYFRYTTFTKKNNQWKFNICINVRCWMDMDQNVHSIS